MRRALAVLSSLFLLSGCNLLKSLQNKKVLAAAVVATPEVAPTHVPGYAQGFPPIAAHVTAQVYFAERQDDLTSGGSDASPPVGVTGATATVTWRDSAGANHTVALRPGAKGGQYLATADDGLAYVTGTTYAFKVVSGGEEFTASVEAPAAAQVKEFVPARYIAPPSWSGFAAQTLTFERSGDELAFYAAFAIDPQHPQVPLDAPTCTNLPITAQADPRSLVDLILDASKWQHDTYTLYKTPPDGGASCFPNGPTSGAPASYVVGIGLGKKGSFSDNLFAGSVAFAGTLDAAALVFVQ